MFWFNGLLFAYTLFLLFLALSYGYGGYKKSRGSEIKESISIEEITVVVAFRNEKENLRRLLEQIHDLKTRPAEFLFVDDHSKDGGTELIKDIQDSDVTLLSMKDKTGKKEAVFAGVCCAQTPYVLCWDADISFSEGYFEKLSTLARHSLIILPVAYKSTRFFEWFFEIDVSLANYINHSSAAIHRPLLCSGANLLFEKSSYLEVISLDTHKHIASGDDAFLLRNMQHAKKSIELSALNFCTVATQNPSSVAAFIKQRSRWFGKTFKLKDKLLNTYGLIQLVFALSFFFVLGFFIINDPILFLKSWLIKSLVEGMLLFPFFYALNKTKLLTILPIYGLVFPLYNILLLTSLFGKKEWKGRPI